MMTGFVMTAGEKLGKNQCNFEVSVMSEARMVQSFPKGIDVDIGNVYPIAFSQCSSFPFNLLHSQQLTQKYS